MFVSILPTILTRKEKWGSLSLAIEWAGSRIVMRTPTNKTISKLSSHKPGLRIHTLAGSGSCIS